MVEVRHPGLDVAQDLRERRGLLIIGTEMLWKVGKACEERTMEGEARQAYAVMCILMEQLDQIDQALAVLGEGTVRQSTLAMTCPGCGAKNAAAAVLNVLLPDDQEAAWETLKCASCGEEVGHYRKDTKGLPKGYALTVYGVMDYEKDGRTLEERLPEAAALARYNVSDPEQLPPAEELRVKALLAGGDPVAIEHGSVSAEARKRRDIRSKLEEARAKMEMALPRSEEDDF
jgi:hypothetical protein